MPASTAHVTPASQRLRCGARGQAETILGADALARGAEPEGIPPGRDHAGTGYLVREDGAITRCRSFYVDDETITECLRAGLHRHTPPAYGPTPPPVSAGEPEREPGTPEPGGQQALPFELPPLAPTPPRRRRRTSRPKADTTDCLQMMLPLTDAV